MKRAVGELRARISGSRRSRAGGGTASGRPLSLFVASFIRNERENHTVKGGFLIGLAVILVLAASCVKPRDGGKTAGPAQKPDEPIRLAAGVYNVHPRWNATGDTLGFLTGFQIMGQERMRDLVLWHPGESPVQAERITKGLALEDFAFSPDGKWVSYQALDAMEREYEWGVIGLADKSVTPLSHGTDSLGGGTWTTDGQAVGFGGSVYRRDGNAWKEAGHLTATCPVPALAPVGTDQLAIACIGQEEDNLFRWKDGTWTTFRPDVGTPDFFRYYPESQQYLMVLVRAWKNENADYSLYILDKELNVQISLRNYNRPVKILGFSQSYIHFLEKSEIMAPEYDLAVTYFYPRKLREETKVERRIWDVRDGVELYSPGTDNAALYMGRGGQAGKKLFSTGKLGLVAWSPDGGRVAVSGQRDRRLPDSFVWVLNLPNSP